jgi:hypothetical protein
MSDPLATYLNDHQAGSVGAIELLQALVQRDRETDLGRFASDLLLAVRADQDVLERLVKKVGSASVMKEALAWLGEKVARLKVPGPSDDGLGTFEALEALLLGITGKRALWEALGRIAVDDPRLAGVDYAALAESAQRQIDLVNARRLRLAPEALRPRA